MPRVFLVLLCGLLPHSLAPAEEFATSLPANTLSYVDFPSIARTREHATNSPLLAMWNAPEMDKARAEADRLGRKGAESSIRASEFATILQGEVCIATLPVGKSDSALLILVELKGDRARLLDMLERTRAGDGGEGVRSEEDEYRGYAVTTYRAPLDGTDVFETTYTFVKGDVYGYCDNLDVVHDVIERREAGEAANLAGVAAFRKSAGHAATADLRFFVSAGAWKRAFPPFEEQAFVIAALGLDILDGVGGWFTLDASGIVNHTHLLFDAKPEKLLRLFATDIDGLGAPAMVPPDATQSISWSIDWAYIHAELLRVLGAFDPPTRREVEALVAQYEKAVGLRLREDVIAALAPGTTLALLRSTAGDDRVLPEIPTLAGIFRTGVLIQELAGEEVIAGLLKKLAALEDAPVNAGSYLGTTIYEGTRPGVPSCAIVGRHLVLAPSVESVRLLIRRQGKQLASYRDTPDYKRALKRAHGKRSVFAVDVDTGTDDGWFLAFHAERSDPASMGAAFFAATPASNWFRRYQDLNVLSIARAEHGLSIRVFWGLKIPDPNADDD